jgi:hypothetical protein
MPLHPTGLIGGSKAITAAVKDLGSLSFRAHHGLVHHITLPPALLSGIVSTLSFLESIHSHPYKDRLLDLLSERNQEIERIEDNVFSVTTTGQDTCIVSLTDLEVHFRMLQRQREQDRQPAQPPVAPVTPNATLAAKFYAASQRGARFNQPANQVIDIDDIRQMPFASLKQNFVALFDSASCSTNNSSGAKVMYQLLLLHDRLRDTLTDESIHDELCACLSLDGPQTASMLKSQLTRGKKIRRVISTLGSDSVLDNLRLPWSQIYNKSSKISMSL